MDKLLLEKNIEKMKLGDEKAFEVVYELTKKQVFFSAYAIIKDYGKAEELMQDTFIKVRKHITSYKKNSNALAWITRIARNLAITTYHKQKKELITDELEQDFLFHASDENTMLNNMLLKKLLTLLNLEERQVVMLHTLGYKHKEIAKQLNKPLGTILWVYNKALKKLQQEMRKNEEK